jgi:hypothetical protein
MATFNKFQAFVEALAEKKHDLGSDTFYVQLLNSAPDAALDAVETDLPADLSTGNGYTAAAVIMSLILSMREALDLCT